ncbi:hypothetical protein [Xenorhabdus sp. PB30.3]|uniref:hypothetical protein n=1 Tax=Xenorhabdus sp. PB30.3 TaxID=2788941 RepID=UPI001E61D928|nr:hypothetical protein [Xenorhabdus sp. PB30.3]MCC8381217.1 hypothetical protein [Xenorhabdus sp. PB30.3]
MINSRPSSPTLSNSSSQYHSTDSVGADYVFLPLQDKPTSLDMENMYLLSISELNHFMMDNGLASNKKESLEKIIRIATYHNYVLELNNNHTITTQQMLRNCLNSLKVTQEKSYNDIFYYTTMAVAFSGNMVANNSETISSYVVAMAMKIISGGLVHQPLTIMTCYNLCKEIVSKYIKQKKPTPVDNIIEYCQEIAKEKTIEIIQDNTIKNPINHTLRYLGEIISKAHNHYSNVKDHISDRDIEILEKLIPWTAMGDKKMRKFAFNSEEDDKVYCPITRGDYFSNIISIYLKNK